jgi:hypothetical protein
MLYWSIGHLSVALNLNPDCAAIMVVTVHFGRPRMVRKEHRVSLETGLSGPICRFDMRMRAMACVAILQRTNRSMLYALPSTLVFTF